MSEEDDSGTDVVVFIDALKPEELEGFLEEIYKGDMCLDRGGTNKLRLREN